MIVEMCTKIKTMSITTVIYVCLGTLLYLDLLSKYCSFLSQDIVAATAACEEVKQSGKFKKMLELVLLIGNFMNAGSKKEQSLGFEMNFLTKVGYLAIILLVPHRSNYAVLPALLGLFYHPNSGINRREVNVC